IAIAFFKIIYLHTGQLGGWNEPQIFIFVAGYCMVDALLMTFIANNMWWLPQTINKGELDYYLVRPVSTLFFVSLRDFAVPSLINLAFTFGIMIWAVLRYPVAIPMWKMLIFFLGIVNGCFIFYCLNVMANILVFWTHSARGFGELVWHLARLGERPDRIYRGWVRRILIFVFPFLVISSFPARVVLDPFDWKILAHMIGVSIALFTATLSLWKLGLRSYSSASS
ncbi:MAG: ABC-2 family transporter protein, partial [Bdellovibrionota bacterium]